MIRIELNYQFSRYLAFSHLTLFVLALAAHFVTLPELVFAQETEAAAEVADEPEAKAEEDQAAETSSDEPKDSQPATEDTSEPSESDAAKDTSEKKPQPSEEQPAEPGNSKEGDDTKEEAPEMKPSEGKAESGDTEAAVETEREIEVEPPKAASKSEPQTPPTLTKHPKKKKCVIGATATLLEKQSGLQFRARVDSGAKSCSLHFENFKIEKESKKDNIVEQMRENIGKVIHFEIKNGDDKTHILTSKIAGYVIIKTSDKQKGKRRYKVPLTFRWKSMEKEVLVTLNKRNHMEYPLLLGRNFLRGDFLVDVELNSDD